MSLPEKGVPSVEEVDNLHRSNRKKKRGEGSFSNDQILKPREEDWMEGRMSFKEMVLRHNGEWPMEDAIQDEGEGNQEEMDTEADKVLPEITCEVDIDGRTNFLLSKEFKKRTWSPWHQSVYVKLLGKRLSLTFMKKRLENMWARVGKLLVTDVENGFFLVRFTDKKDMDFALTAGPWVIMDHYLAFRSWEPDFEPNQAAINRIMAWVRLPQFPVEYVNTDLVKSIGNWIGKFIRLDAATTSLARGRFARACVELDLSKPLHSEYKVEGRLKRIEYEGLHIICYSCGQYGHRADGCPMKSNTPAKEGTTASCDVEGQSADQREEGTHSVKEDERYGPWMLVNKQRGSKWMGSSKVGDTKGKEVLKQKESILMKSQFGVLSNLESEAGEMEKSAMVAETQVHQEQNQGVNGHVKEKRNLKGSSKLVETSHAYKVVWDTIEETNAYNKEEIVDNVAILDAKVKSKEVKQGCARGDPTEKMVIDIGGNIDEQPSIQREVLTDAVLLLPSNDYQMREVESSLEPKPPDQGVILQVSSGLQLGAQDNMHRTMSSERNNLEKQVLLNPVTSNVSL